MKSLLEALPRMPIKPEPHPGLWVYTDPSVPGCPVMHRFPPPMHPLEWLACEAGMCDSFSSPAELAQARSVAFLPYTEVIHQWVDGSLADIRLWWHACTPLSVPIPEWSLAVAHAARRDAAWIAAGFSPDDGRDAEARAFCRDRIRPKFWSDETC